MLSAHLLFMWMSSEKKNHGNIVCVTQHVSRQTTSIQARVSNVLAGKKGVARLEQGGVTALRPFPKLGMLAGENIVGVALLRI